MNINIPPHPTPPHDQRNNMNVTWTLTSHPTPPQPTPSSKKINQKTEKTPEKTTKHPGALQRPWQLVACYATMI